MNKRQEINAHSKDNAKRGMGRNRRMSDATYKLRRKVIELLYEAKGHVTLPRVEVRIQERPKKSIHSGLAVLNRNIIFIPEHTIAWGEDVLREVVLHEVVHAVTGFRHDKKCPLMSPCHDPKRPLKKDVVYKHFVKYFTK